MSIAGSSSGDDWKIARSSWICTSSPQSVGGPRAGEMGGGSRGSSIASRIFLIGAGSVMKAMRRMSPPQAGHSSGNCLPMRARSLAQAIREVSWERGWSFPAGAPRLSAGGRGGDEALPIASAVTAWAAHLRRQVRGPFCSIDPTAPATTRCRWGLIPG
jgi:hypothetical protein